MLYRYILLWLMFFGVLNAQNAKTDALRRLKSSIEYIEENYVDSLNIDQLVEDAIIGMLKDLDPHSYYNSKEDIALKNEKLNGSFKGVGVRYVSLNDTAYLLEVSSDSPAEKARLEVGDALISVEGESLVHADVSEILKKNISNNKSFKLMVLRAGKLKKVKITPEALPILSVTSVGFVEDYLYIKILRFGRNTVREIENQIRDFEINDSTKIIVDLRGNGGGYLSTSIALSDMFLESGKVVVETKAKGAVSRTYKARNVGVFEKNPLYVFVDEQSASASEIFTGAIQDHDRGIIVGRRTFGKGLVQSQHQLNNGAVIRLTTSRYYTPAGRCIQKSYDKGEEIYDNDLRLRMDNGEYFHSDSIPIGNANSFQTLNLNRVVFDNGGITPDLFVAMDTTSFSDSLYHFLKDKKDYQWFLSHYRDLKKMGVKKYFADEYPFVLDDEVLNKEFNNFIKMKLAYLIFSPDLVSLEALKKDDYFKKIKEENLAPIYMDILVQNIKFEAKELQDEKE